MIARHMAALAAIAVAPVAAAQIPAEQPDANAPGWHVVWADEFNGDRIDPAHWSLANDCAGGGNDERQCYTPRVQNAAVHDGQLVITARPETWSGPAFPPDQRVGERATATATKPYTSARLSTATHAAFRYGRIEVRARLPQGQGTWPAIWMMPEESHYGRWAASGEIDIMEAVNLGAACPAPSRSCGSDGRENGILGTIHFGGVPPANRFIGATTQMPSPRDGFHTYAVTWTPAGIVWAIDGVAYETRVPHEWHTSATTAPAAPFDRPFHIILNLAIGGHLPEGRNDGGVDLGGRPRTMEVDWVHVSQCTIDPADPALCHGGA